MIRKKAVTVLNFIENCNQSKIKEIKLGEVKMEDSNFDIEISKVFHVDTGPKDIMNAKMNLVYRLHKPERLRMLNPIEILPKLPKELEGIKCDVKQYFRK